VDERSTRIDVTAWRVAPLSDGFTDEVMRRIDEPVEPSSVDALDLLEPAPDDERLALVPRSSQARTARAPATLGTIALAVAAAILLVLWLARPLPTEAPATSAPTSPAMHVEAGPVEALDRDGIRRVIREQFQPAAKLCYEVLQINDAPRGPGAMQRPYVSPRGRVPLMFAVAREGDRGIVVRAEIGVEPDIDDRTFHECLLAAMRKSVFEGPFSKDPVEIEIHLVFGPDETSLLDDAD